MMPTRDRTGRFTLSDSTIQYKDAAERMKACLERDVRAAEHAEGRVYERRHYHVLPNPDRLALILVNSVEPTLFDLVAA